MSKLIYPWTAGDLDASKVVKAEVMQEMRSRYPMVIGMPPPPKRVLTALNSIVRELLARSDHLTVVPWMVCVTSSVSLLQSLARLIPCTLMLTRLLKPVNVTTDALIDLFKRPVPADDFELDPAGEALHAIRNRGVLVWENFSEFKSGGFHFSSQFMSLLSYRMEKRKITVFLCASNQTFNAQATQELFDQIEKSVGKNIPIMLREAASWKYLKVEAEKFTFKTEEV